MFFNYNAGNIYLGMAPEHCQGTQSKAFWQVATTKHVIGANKIIQTNIWLLFSMLVLQTYFFVFGGMTVKPMFRNNGNTFVEIIGFLVAIKEK